MPPAQGAGQGPDGPVLVGPGEQRPAPGDRAPVLQLDAGGPVSFISSLAFSPDGDTLYAASWDKVVHVWNRGPQGFVADPARNFRVPIGPELGGAIESMAVSPDGQWLAVGGSGVTSYDTGFRQTGFIWPNTALSAEDLIDVGAIYVFDTRTHEAQMLRGHTGVVMALTFVPASPRFPNRPPLLVSLAVDRDPHSGRKVGVVRVWDVQGGVELAAHRGLPWRDEQPQIFFDLSAEAVGPDPRHVRVAIAWGDNPKLPERGQMRVWNVWDAGPNRMLQADSPNTFACEMVPPMGTILASQWGNGGRPVGEITRWTVGGPDGTALLPRQFVPVGGGGLCVELSAFSRAGAGPPDHVLAVSCTPGHPKQYRFAILRLDGRRTRFPAVPIGAISRPTVAVSGVSGYVAVAGNQDHSIRLHQLDALERGQLQPAAVLHPEGAVMRSAWFGVQGKNPGLVFSPLSGTELKDAPQRRNGDLFLDLATGAVSTDPQQWTSTRPDRAGWRPEFVPAQGRGIIRIHGPDKRLVDVPLVPDQLSPVAAVCPPTADHPALLALAVSQAGEPVLSLYNAETGDRLRRLRGHIGTVRHLEFSPDGRFLVSAAEDRTINVWWLGDLDAIIGRHGHLSGLYLLREGGKVVVERVDPTAQPGLRDGLRPGDVIEACFEPGGRVRPVAAPKGVFGFFINRRKPGEPATLRVRRPNGQVADVPVVAEQAVDEQKPLFSVFLRFDAERQAWSWIGWNPLGPFESSDQRIETLVGWHFNTGDPAAPATFAEIGKYRKEFFGRGLLHALFRTGRVPADWPPAPPPEMSLLLQSGEQILAPDGAGRFHLGAPTLQVTVGIPDLTRDRIAAVVWELDGRQGPLQFERGIWTADVPPDVWRRNAEHRLRVTITPRDQRVAPIQTEQRIVFAAGAAPQPPPGGLLPQPIIVAPLSGTVVGEAQTTVDVQFQPPARPVPFQVTLFVNGQVATNDGQPVTRTYQGQAEPFRAPVPLQPGANRVEVRVTDLQGQGGPVPPPAVEVIYRRPPSVVNAAALQKGTSQDVQFVIDSPDSPLQGALVRVNGVPQPPDLVTLGANADGTWTVTAADVRLNRGRNAVQIQTFDAHQTPTAAIEHRVLSRTAPAAGPTIYEFERAGSRDTRQSTLPFRVRSSSPLARVDLLTADGAATRFDVPQPVNDGGALEYRFEPPISLEPRVNTFYLVARDQAGGQTIETFQLSAVDQPYAVAVDGITAFASVAGGQAAEVVLKPEIGLQGDVRFNDAAPSAAVNLSGRIVLNAGRPQTERRDHHVQVWVNGFLQDMVRIEIPEQGPFEMPFTARLLLSRRSENRIRIEVPTLKSDQRMADGFTIDCAAPDSKQNLHVLIIAHDCAEADAAQLEQQARQGLHLDGGGDAKFGKLDIRTLAGMKMARAPVVKAWLLTYHKQFVARPGGRSRDVLLVYYLGREVATRDKQHYILVTDDNAANPHAHENSAIRSDRLADRLSSMPGAHLLFLDVTQTARPASAPAWADDARMGVLRSTWLDVPAVPPEKRIVAALTQAVPSAPNIGALASALETTYKTLAPAEYQKTLFYAAHIPPDLKGLVVGETP